MDGGKRLTAVAAGLLLLTGCSGDAVVPAVSSSAPASPAQAAGPPPSASRAEMVVDFEVLSAGQGVVADGADVGSAAVPAVLRTGDTEAAGAGAVDGRRPGTTAMQFPRPCVEDSCGKLVVEVDPLFVPAFSGEVRYGAVFRLEPEQTSEGGNIVQRGFATGDRGQWKLQVDGAAGRPSCVVAPGGGDVHFVAARTKIADGEWHEVVCHRVRDQLSILVDGEVENTTELSSPLVVAPEGPVRIGGKNVKPDNDQFFGAVDEVFFVAEQP